MYSIALRYAEKFAPKEGTIQAHKDLIEKNGFVWYGKMGSPVSDSNIQKILSQEKPRILLIHSGGIERYWAYISDIRKDKPSDNDFPSYYRSMADKFKTWFCIYKFELAERDIMSKCIVTSSRSVLSNASKYSMSPYFLIEYYQE